MTDKVDAVDLFAQTSDPRKPEISLA